MAAAVRRARDRVVGRPPGTRLGRSTSRSAPLLRRLAGAGPPARRPAADGPRPGRLPAVRRPAPGRATAGKPGSRPPHRRWGAGHPPLRAGPRPPPRLGQAWATGGRPARQAGRARGEHGDDRPRRRRRRRAAPHRPEADHQRRQVAAALDSLALPAGDVPGDRVHGHRPAGRRVLGGAAAAKGGPLHPAASGAPRHPGRPPPQGVGPPRPGRLGGRRRRHRHLRRAPARPVQVRLLGRPDPGNRTPDARQPQRLGDLGLRVALRRQRGRHGHGLRHAALARDPLRDHLRHHDLLRALRRPRPGAGGPGALLPAQPQDRHRRPGGPLGVRLGPRLADLRVAAAGAPGRPAAGPGGQGPARLHGHAASGRRPPGPPPAGRPDARAGDGLRGDGGHGAGVPGSPHRLWVLARRCLRDAGVAGAGRPAAPARPGHPPPRLGERCPPQAEASGPGWRRSER
jgi:hypothetical protein